MTIELENAEARNLENPDTFKIPSLLNRTTIPNGVFAKLMFNQAGSPIERMWVEVTGSSDDIYTGRLANIPAIVDLAQHASISFEAMHVIDLRVPWTPPLPL